MAAKLAHEIRNPLSSIKMNIALVGYEIDRLTKDDAESAKESRSLLQSIDSEVRRIQRVTQDYLKFARIPKPRSEKVPINDVLGVRLAFMESLFQSQNVTLHLALDESLPPIRADEEQLWQAVLNLVQNALEAMPGGGSLTVTTARKDPDVVLTIADTGKGMCETERQQVFKPFFSTKQSGTGLGLPLTQQIIVEHGGQIVCESIEGKGTTFLIRLPIEPKKSQSRF
jgi:signal transduction histidine kinase